MQYLSVKDALAPSMRINRAEVRWGALTSFVAIVGVGDGIASLVSGEPAAVPLGCLMVAARAGGRRARDLYGHSWRQEVESTVRTTLQHTVGRTPDVEVRAAVQGDPTPEPRDGHVAPVRPERLS